MQIIYLISKLINHWMAGLHNLKTILSSCSSVISNLYQYFGVGSGHVKVDDDFNIWRFIGRDPD